MNHSTASPDLLAKLAEVKKKKATGRTSAEAKQWLDAETCIDEIVKENMAVLRDSGFEDTPANAILKYQKIAEVAQFAYDFLQGLDPEQYCLTAEQVSGLQYKLLNATYSPNRDLATAITRRNGVKKEDAALLDLIEQAHAATFDDEQYDDEPEELKYVELVQNISRADEFLATAAGIVFADLTRDLPDQAYSAMLNDYSAYRNHATVSEVFSYISPDHITTLAAQEFTYFQGVRKLAHRLSNDHLLHKQPYSEKVIAAFVDACNNEESPEDNVRAEQAWLAKLRRSYDVMLNQGCKPTQLTSLQQTIDHQTDYVQLLNRHKRALNKRASDGESS